jgi:hypothetical protein
MSALVGELCQCAAHGSAVPAQLHVMQLRQHQMLELLPAGAASAPAACRCCLRNAHAAMLPVLHVVIWQLSWSAYGLKL